MIRVLPTAGPAVYPLALAFCQRFVLEPQAQVIWQHVGFNRDFDGQETIGIGSTSGGPDGLACLAETTFVTGSGQVWQPYVRANFWESWGAPATTIFDGSPDQMPLLEQAT